MAFIENDGIVRLMKGSQLKKLNDELQFKEEELILMDKIDSEPERAKYLKDCNGVHKLVITLLAKCNDFNKINQDGSDNLKHVDIIMSHVRNWCTQHGWKGLLEYLELETKVFSKKCIKFRKRYVIDCQEKADGVNKDAGVESDVQELATDNQVEMKQHYGVQEFAGHIQEYVKIAINVGLQCARNCGARSKWISKIETHIEMLNQVLRDQNVGNLQGMAEHLYNEEHMLEFAKHCQKGSSQANSEAYKLLLQKEREQFSDMATNRKMNELVFPGEFDNLSDPQKLEVWRGIINESTSALPKSKSKSISCGVTSHLLPIEYIFGKGDDTIWEFTLPTLLVATMPNGMLLARDIAANEIEDKKHGLRVMGNE